ncbi:glycosyltransferase [Pseudarthrobacter sp. NPDC055928]|uniref:glycosyltransferase n=1 Tax=Pseudarthrobacter sp. NPDC055928 TaxID=3345661 RepID=UPI0035D8F249
MANFLFSTLDAGGNVPPAVGIAGELVRDGHRVRFLGNRQQAGQIEAVGAEFRAYDGSFRMTPAEHMSTLQQISMMVSAFTHPGVARDIVEEARRDPPDVVIVDCLLLSGIDAAVRAGLRTAVLVHSFYAFFDGPFRRTPLTAVITARGLGPRRVMKRADRILVCSDPLLDPAGGKNGNGKLAWTGAVVDVAQPADPAPSGSPPKVLVSLSTTAFPGQEGFLHKVLQAVADLPLEVVVTTGPAIDPASFTAPPNTIVHRYLPHRDVMPDCAAVIGHGGHATTMLALGHGLPLVIAPMHPLLDQRMVGKAVQDAGAGLVIKASSSREQIAGVVKTVLDSADFRSATTMVGQRIREADGARTGARVLAGMIS